MTVKVDQERCIGSGVCTAIAPELFRLDAEGIAEPTAVAGAAEDGDAVEEAILTCPVSAISRDDA